MGESIKSLHSRHSELANGYFQLKVLSNNSLSNHHEVNFTEKLRLFGSMTITEQVLNGLTAATPLPA